MRQPSNPRRVRPRGNGKRHPSSKNYPVESNGPDVKIRGTAQQVFEKYLALARDAATSGNRVAAEGFYQHADHYYRLVNADQSGGQSGHGRDGRQGRFPHQAGESSQTDAAPHPGDAPQPELPTAQGASVENDSSKPGNGDGMSRRPPSNGNGQGDSEPGDSFDSEPSAA